MNPGDKVRISGSGVVGTLVGAGQSPFSKSWMALVEPDDPSYQKGPWMTGDNRPAYLTEDGKLQETKNVLVVLYEEISSL